MRGTRVRWSGAVFLSFCLLATGCAGRGSSGPKSQTAHPPEETGTYVVVVKNYANLRAADSGRAAILRKLPQDSEMLVLTRNGRWYQVLEEETNALGWVHETYVKEVER